jgi:hypothetical protein
MSKTFDDLDLPAETLARPLDLASDGTSTGLEASALLRQACGAEAPDIPVEVLSTQPSRGTTSPRLSFCTVNPRCSPS